MVDDYLAESAGNRAAILDRLGQSAKALAVTTAHIMSYMPFPGVNIAGELALVVLGEQDLETAMQGIALGVMPGDKLMGAAGKALKASAGSIQKMVGRTFVHASAAATRLAAKGGPRLGGLMTGLSAGAKAAGKAGNKFTAWLNKGPRTYTVYLGLVETRAQYVGVTKRDPRVRIREHNRMRRALGKPLFTKPRIVLRGLTRNQARCIEQVLIISNPHFDNRINSIASGRSIFQGALEWGSNHLVQSGKALFY